MSTISASTTSTTAYVVTADTTGTLVLKTGASPTTAVTVGTDQSVTLAGTLAVQSQNISPYTGFKNRIINGAMVIDQRNAGASVTPTNATYAIDRFVNNLTQASKFSVQQSTTAPAGFSNSMLVTSLSAYSITSTDNFQFEQRVEGFNFADMAWGTASASAVTLSFWVRSSLTGTFGGSLRNNAGDRSYPFTYSISAANTWEQKTVTIAGDTTGTWVGGTNGIAVRVGFSLGTGSTLAGAAGSWASANYLGATGATSVVGTNGATFYITGVQLEKGSTATSFDYRPYGTELQLCQRYYWQSFQGQTPSGWGANFLTTSGYQGAALTTGMINQNFFLPVPMRAAPTGAVWDHVGASGKISSFNPNVANNSGETGSVASTSTTTFMLTRTSGASASQIGAYVSLNSEL